MRPQRVGNGCLKARIPAALAAVMRALQLRGADTTMLRSLPDEAWRELLPMLDRAHLTLQLAQQSHSGLPGWVRQRLSDNLSDTARHWERVCATYREAAATLDANGLEYLVLKGFTQAPDFAPRPELRWQSDIDFYVPRHHIPSAVRSLQGIGYASYEAEDYRYADHVPTLVRFGTWKWRGNRYDPEVPPAIEVHFCLWNNSVSSIPIPEADEFWKRRGVRAFGGLIFPALHLVDHIGYFAMHILRDIFGAEWSAHHVRELAVFLNQRAGDDAFWREWTLMHSPRLRRMQAIAFALAVEWFSCDISSAVSAEIDSLSPQARAWIEVCGGTPLETPFRRTRDGRLLQLLLAETPAAKKNILWKALTSARIPGPAMIASSRSRPSMPTTPKLISSYLAYPAHIASKIWMNGSAVLRFLAHACQTAGLSDSSRACSD